MRGTVRFFKSERGYGFITAENGESVFIHQSNILMPGYRTLSEGQQVNFDIEYLDRGPSAINCQPEELPEQPKSFRENIIQKGDL